MNPADRYRDDLNLALILADYADTITQDRFGADDLVIDSKPDMTPVTDADRAVEDRLRNQLSHARSRDSVLGEERGVTGHSNRQWIIDPIDATKNFVRGVPVWATLIGLQEDGEMVVGVVSAPALRTRWWAARGHGAWMSRVGSARRRLHVSAVPSLDQASLSYSSLDGWLQRDRGHEFLNLQSSCWRSRAFGDFWSYMMVAEGTVDIACEPDLEIHDMAALIPIVEEAGGRFSSLRGEPGPYGGNGLATNGLLHDQVLEMLDWESSGN